MFDRNGVVNISVSTGAGIAALPEYDVEDIDNAFHDVDTGIYHG